MVRADPGGPRFQSYARRMLGPWRSPNFRWYWAGSSVQSVSQGMQFLVLAWLVLEVTGSKTQLGLVLFLYGVPNVGLLVVGGVIADRIDRKRLLITVQAAVGALIAVLATLSATGMVEVWQIYLSGVVLGVLQALNQPARVAMLSDLVEQETLLDAVAGFNMAVHLGRIGGPPLVGAVIDGWGISAALFLNASFYVISVLCLSRIRTVSRQSPKPPEPFLRNFLAGFVQIRDAPILLTVIILACSFGGFGMSHLQVIPAFAKDQLGSGAYEAGLLLLASGIGAVIGNLCLTFMGRAWLYRWFLACLVLFCVSLTLFTWTPWYWGAWGLFLVVGILSLGTVWPLATTILQMTAPADVRGRVMGVLHFTPGFHYLGALPLAAAAGWVGWPVAISVAAAVCLFVTIWFGMARNAGRKLASSPWTPSGSTGG